MAPRTSNINNNNRKKSGEHHLLSGFVFWRKKSYICNNCIKIKINENEKNKQSLLHHSKSPEPPMAKLGKVGHVWASLGMTSPKWHTQLLPFIDVCQHAKNQNETSSPSRDLSDQRFLQSDWPKRFPAYNLRIRLLQHLKLYTVIGNDLIIHFKSLPGSLHHS